MTKSITLLGALFLLVSCATPLHVKVDSHINRGDSREKVRQVLGDPDDFGPSAEVVGGTDWTYRNSGSICTLSFDGELVSQISCDSSNYVSLGRKFLRGLGTAMQGAGEGAVRAVENRPKRVHCTPDLLGGFNCQ